MVNNKKKSGADTDFKNLYRLDMPRQKKYFVNKPYVNLFGGTVIGAHIASYFKGMIKLTPITTDKPFIIDPMIYMFARDREHMMKMKIAEDGASTGKAFKKSFEKLAQAYGDVIAKIVVEEEKEIDIPHFFDGKIWKLDFMKKIAKNAIDFQKGFIPPGQMKLPKDVEELMEPEELEPLYKEGRIFALVPPYFYIPDIKSKWYMISLKLAEISQKLKDSYKLCPVLCISKELIADQKAAEKIIGDYNNFERIVFWVSKFNEFYEPEDNLKAMINFVSLLNEKLKVYSAYGGYFFVLLSKFGLEGFSQGMCYAESKDVDKLPSLTTPPIRYYVPCLHRKVIIDDARSYYGSHPKELCNCTVCSRLKKKITSKGIKINKHPAKFIDRFFKMLNIDIAVNHFLICRKQELENTQQKSLKYLVGDLKLDLEHSENVDMPMFRGFENFHLNRWIKALSEYL